MSRLTDRVQQRAVALPQPRTTNPHGCVTLQRYHFYREQGLPTTRMLLWLTADQLRAAFGHVVVADYRCHYDWRSYHITNTRDGVFHPTRDALSQGTLFPFNPQESLVLCRPQTRAQHARLPFSTQPLWLFEWIPRA